jgi:hypothetical protein
MTTDERTVMSASPRGRLLAAVLAVPLVAGLAACENDAKKAKETASQPCPSTISQTASTALPSDVPAPNGKAYSFSSQGRTQVWFYAVDGGPDRLESLRDGYDTQLKSQGYTIEGTDQEHGAEAESQFKGPHEGTTNFRPLCTGKVVLRVKLTS